MKEISSRTDQQHILHHPSLTFRDTYLAFEDSQICGSLYTVWGLWPYRQAFVRRREATNGACLLLDRVPPAENSLVLDS